MGGDRYCFAVDSDGRGNRENQRREIVDDGRCQHGPIDYVHERREIVQDGRCLRSAASVLRSWRRTARLAFCILARRFAIHYEAFRALPFRVWAKIRVTITRQ